ncbi:MAG: high light inducible protein [Bacteroidota bacterium]
MERKIQETTSTNVSNLPLKGKQNIHAWGFTSSTEILNGRLAMIGFISALLLELFSGQGVLQFLNLI